MICFDAVGSQDKYELVEHTPSLDSHVDSLTDRLRWAIRHDRVDLARRIHSELIGLGREVQVIELAAASGAIGGGE